MERKPRDFPAARFVDREGPGASSRVARPVSASSGSRKLVRAALATADRDPVPDVPREGSSRRPLARPGSGSRPRGRGRKHNKHRLALVAGAILAVAMAGILANALLLQRTRHPAPLLGQPASAQKPAPARASVRPQRPEPAPAAAPDPSPARERASADRPVIETAPAPKPRQPAPAAQAAAKPSDPIGQLLRGSKPEPRPAALPERKPAAPAARRPAAPVETRPTARVERRPASPGLTRPAASSKPRPAPEPSRAVAAAQRALVKLGFVLEADGVAGATTRKAIERYERDRGLPARGVLTPDLARRLGSESGIAIE